MNTVSDKYMRMLNRQTTKEELVYELYGELQPEAVFVDDEWVNEKEFHTLEKSLYKMKKADLLVKYVEVFGLAEF
jgi:hypothetical protein